MALTKVSSSLVSDNAVTSGKIADGGIATADIADVAVTTAKIANNAILTQHIDDGQVTTAQLGADAVTADKIADDAISEEHLDVTVITSLTAVTAATGDLLMVADVSDSNNLKKIPVSSILAGTHTGAINTSGTISSGAITSTGAIMAQSGGGLYLRATDSSDTDAWIVYQYTDDTLRMNFTGAGADEFTLSSSGNAAFTGTISAPLSYIGSGSFPVTPNTNGDDLVIFGSGSHGISILSGTNNDGNIFFGDSGGNVRGKLAYSHNGDYMTTTSSGAYNILAGGDIVLDTGDSSAMRIKSSALVFNNAANNEHMISAAQDGAVTLYHNGNPKIATNSGGVTVTGTAILGGASFVDNATAYFGTGLDLRIWHDGSNSYIRDTNAASDLLIQSNNIVLENTSGHNMIHMASGGAVQLYHNNVSKVKTTATGAQIGLNNSTITRLQLYGATNAEHQIKFGNDGTNGEKDGAIRYFGEAHGTTANRRAMTLSTALTERMRIHGNGRVSIGITTAQDILEIRGVAGTRGGLTISNTNHNEPAVSFARNSTATARMFITEPGSLHTSSLNFQTSNASGGPNLITAMTIDQNQKVGIGTIAPGYRLHVNDTTSSGAGILLTNSQNQAGAYSDLKWQYAVSDSSYASGLRFKQVDTSHGGQLEFYTDNPSGTYTKQMVIDENGDVKLDASFVSGARLHVEDTSDSMVLIYETGTAPYTATLKLASQSMANFGSNVQYTSDAETLTIENYGRSIQPTHTAGSIRFRTKVGNSSMTEVMRLQGHSGQVTTPQNQAFRARATTGQVLASGWKKVGYDSLIQSRGAGNGGYSTSNSRFTALVDGWYQFNAQWTANANSDNDGTFSIFINGSTSDLAGSVSMTDTGSYHGHVVSGCCYLAATHYVEAWRYSSVETTTRTSNPYGGWFSGYLIG